jgi:hypothetical protein
VKARRRRPRAPRPVPRASGHVRADGAPKAAYRTRAEALSAAQLAWTLERAELDAYRCDLCHQWHIGRSSALE